MKASARIAAHVGREQYLQWESENGGFPLRWKPYREPKLPQCRGYQVKLPSGEWLCVVVPR